MEILCDVPHCAPNERTEGGVRFVDSVLRRHKLEVANLNVNTSHAIDFEGGDPTGFWPTLIDADSDARARKIAYVRDAIYLAQRWKAKSVSIVPAGPGPVARGAMALLADSLRAILKEAGEVRVGIEYEPGLWIGCCDVLLEVLERVGDPRLGANLDIGHAVCAGERIEETIERLKGRIWNVHVEDIRGETHEHLIPGEGDIDFASVKRALDRAGYDGFWTLELYPYKKDPGGAGRTGLAFLKKVLDGGVVR